MSTSAYLHGIGGWLRLLIVGLTILGPISGFGRITSDLQSAEEQFPILISSTGWQQYKQFSWYVFWIATAISISAGYRLWKLHVADSVRFAIIGLWLVGPVSCLGQFAVTWFAFGTRAQAAVPEMLSALVASIIGAGIWTAYLHRSTRVKNTYVAMSYAKLEA